MKKKFCLSLLLLMAVLLTVSLVACNSDSVNDFNKNVEVNSETAKVDINADNSYLKFSFPKGAPSIFNSLWIKDENYSGENGDDYQFDIEDVEYAIVYTNDNGVTTEIPMGNVTKDMVAADDTQYLNKAGHNVIHLSTVYRGQTISGSFTLHLKDHSAEVNLILVTFDLTVDASKNKYAYATFGDTNDAAHNVTVNLTKGTTFTSWNEFITTLSFVYENQGDENNMALIGIQNVEDSSDKYEVTSTGSFTFDEEAEYKTIWTSDTVTVTFDLCAPNNDYSSSYNPAIYFDGNLQNSDGTDYKTQVLAKNVGVVSRPDADKFNVYRGYYFAGWYTEKDGGTLWAFSSVVGSESRTLYGHWRTREYSAVIYSMGGELSYDVESSKIGTTTLTKDNIPSNYYLVNGYIKNGVAGEMARLTITGLTYNVTYDKYVVEIELTNSTSTETKTIYVTLGDLLNKVSKGGTYTDATLGKSFAYLKAEGYYTEYTCNTTEKFALTGKTISDVETYILWSFNDLSADDFNGSAAAYNTARAKMLSLYYTDVIYANEGYEIKADGTVKLTKIDDETVHRLEVPATLWIKGKEYPLSEFASKSTMNCKGLVEIDFTNATNLTTIGDSAFAHDIGLSIVQGQENTKVKTVGANAFDDTLWEDNYATNNSSDVIVFNKTIYKYVGKDVAITELNLTADGYANVFNKVNNISSEAFASLTALETITLPASIDTIEDLAFENLTKLKSVNLTSDTTSGIILKNVGSDAFEGCTTYLSTNGDQYDETANAIILGNLYYKSLESGTSATVPATIKYIAENAFENSGSVETITFKDASKIEYIGADAFYATKWIQPNSELEEEYFTETETSTKKFSIVNGMLVAFYSSSYQTDDTDIIIPSTVKQINSHAFNSYAQYVKSIQFNANLETIEEDAFIGAISLKTFIFANAEENDTTGLAKVPSVSANSFENNKSQLISGITFYFSQKAIDKMRSLSSTTLDTISSAANSWVELYSLYPDKFAVEDLKEVRVNTAVVPNIMLKTSSGTSTAIDDYLNIINNDGSKKITNGLIVETSAGVKKYVDLEFGTGENSAKAKLITNSNEYKGLYNKNLGFNQYVIWFTYQGSKDKCQINAGDENIFVVTEYEQVQGETFYTSDTYTYNKDASNVINALALTSSSNCWFTEIQGIDNSTSLATFYTTNTSLAPVFYYKTVTGVTKYISGKYVTLENFTRRNETGETVAYINVNFYNLGTYRFTFTYKVQDSKYKEISQTSNITIPLNANWQTYLAKNTLNLVGENGSLTSLYINSSNFDLSNVDIDTTELGMGTCYIQYTKSTNTVNSEVLKLDVVYSVVLEADPTMFEYDVYNSTKKTLRITACSAKTAQTIVLPTTYSWNVGKDADGNDLYEDYTIEAVGYNTSSGSAITGVFEDFTLLETVYLPETLKVIGTNTFKGCTLLKEVYTATASQKEPTALDESTNFEILSTTVEKIGTVEVTNYQFTKVPDKMVLPTTVTETVMETNETTYTLTLIYKSDLFASYKGIVYVPYSTYYLDFVESNMLSNKVVFICSEKPTSNKYNFVLYDEETKFDAIIANNAALKASEDENKDKYTFIYTLDSQTSTSITHFVYDISAASITKTINYNNVKLKNLDGVTANSTIAIALTYTFDGSNGVQSVDKIVEIQDTITVGNSIDTIYIPDSIYTIFTIKNSGGTIITPTIYASSSGYMFDTIEYLPATLEYIGNGAFMNCSSLTNIDFTKSSALSYIDAGAFMNAGVQKLDLSKNTLITIINTETFKGAYKLEEITLPSTVTTLAMSAFSDCILLSNISGLDNVTTYASNVFNNCISLVEFTISTKVTNIGNGAFAGCKALTLKVEYRKDAIPSGWAYQWYDEFNNAVVFDCKNNNTANDGKYYYYDSSSKVRYILSGTEAIVAIQAYSLTSVTLPATITVGGTKYTVTTIIESAFEGNDRLTSVTVTNSLKSIEMRAFYGCSSLKEFNFVDDNNGLTTIMDSAFEGCTALKNIPKVAA